MKTNEKTNQKTTQKTTQKTNTYNKDTIDTFYNTLKTIKYNNNVYLYYKYPDTNKYKFFQKIDKQINLVKNAVTISKLLDIITTVKFMEYDEFTEEFYRSLDTVKYKGRLYSYYKNSLKNQYAFYLREKTKVIVIENELLIQQLMDTLEKNSMGIMKKIID